MADAFSDYQVSLESPAVRVMSVTPNDSEDLAEVGRALNVATSGLVQITTSAGTTAAIYVVAGIAFPIRASRIWNTGTTATGIVVLS